METEEQKRARNQCKKSIDKFLDVILPEKEKRIKEKREQILRESADLKSFNTK